MNLTKSTFRLIYPKIDIPKMKKALVLLILINGNSIEEDVEKPERPNVDDLFDF